MKTKTLARIYLLIISWYCLFTYTYTIFLFFLSSKYDLSIIGWILYIPIEIGYGFKLIAPTLPSYIWYNDLDWGNIIVLITSILIVILITPVNIILLKKENYSNNFLRFWSAIILTNLAVFTLEVVYYGGKIIPVIIEDSGLLVSSVLILLSSNYLYRQQKNSLPSSN